MRKKLTKDDFVRKAREKHGEKYGYDKAVYVNAHTKIKIYCKKCEKSFWQTPDKHSHGQGCPVCGGTKLLVKDDFVKEARKKHGNKYEYGRVNYVSSQTKVEIYCKKCKKYFWQEPSNHLQGHGCSTCGIKKQAESKIKTFNIERAKKVHGPKYDYSKFVYKGANTKGTIICPDHVPFEQTPDNHLHGHGCNRCSVEKRAKLKIATATEKFIKQVQELHKFKYDYSRFIYKKTGIKSTIICPIHGPFEQIPSSHLKGYGCPICAIGKKAELKVLIASSKFLERAKKVHGPKYDYSQFIYKKAKIRGTIICPDHGPFEQTPDKHLQGQGCPICSSSHGERDTRLVLKRKFGLKDTDMIKNKTYPDLIDINPLSYDIWLIKHNILIEYHGIQHYIAVPFFGGEEQLKIQRRHDRKKKAYAKKHGIKLIILKYTIETPEQIEEYLRKKLGPLIPISDSFTKSWGKKS
jgi:Zn finger protein HypA/HybF involved in hydrogenase expression